MTWQHYIGEGPEAQKIISECDTAIKEFRAALDNFLQYFGFAGAWTSEGLVGGPLTAQDMPFETARVLGVTSRKHMVGNKFAWKPNLGTKKGKEMKARLAKVNAVAFNYSEHILKATGMCHTTVIRHSESKSGQALANATAGYTKDKVLVLMPLGVGWRNEPQPTPPPWLKPVKESEFLAAQGL